MPCYNQNIILPRSDTLIITIRLFAGHREAVGKAETTVDIPEGSTVGHLAHEVTRTHPSITADASRLVVAVNQEFVDHSHVLEVGDEVALIPPVSGGAEGLILLTIRLNLA